MKSQGLIPLDERVPFVRAVCAIIDGNGTYDDAIALLIETEEKCGVRIIYDAATGSRALGLRPKEPPFRPTMAEVLEINADLDTLWHRYRQETVAEGDEDDSSHVFHFFSMTWFLVGGTDFANDHLITCSSGSLNSWTQRAWGAELARWANVTDWMPDYRAKQPAGEWSYIMFCYYLYTLIERYDDWIRVVLKVIQTKCDRQLANGAGAYV